MREILFRGKCIGTKEWVYGYFFAKPILEKYFIELGNEMWQVDPITVGQYTGLQDKNGKKIFEGDILLFKFEPIGEQKAIVEYNTKAHAFLMTPLNDFQFAMMYEGKVIGNIHDNPELLEVK